MILGLSESGTTSCPLGQVRSGRDAGRRSRGVRGARARSASGQSTGQMTAPRHPLRCTEYMGPRRDGARTWAVRCWVSIASHSPTRPRREGLGQSTLAVALKRELENLAEDEVAAVAARTVLTDPQELGAVANDRTGTAGDAHVGADRTLRVPHRPALNVKGPARVCFIERARTVAQTDLPGDRELALAESAPGLRQDAS
jgi:hypothetical protein